ncbi:MAG TPA: dicarboxylate/amino acid:cation symporter, partial [Spirochaetes bacterium]|nr:dicarboxylate/amino acid:cation symporter [Spirochaetota bacterium]
MASKNKTGNYLGAAILVAMTAGIAAGAVQGKDARMWAPLGEIFMQLIKMLVVPLVAVSIVSGAASIGNTRSAGKIGIATFGYYFLTTIIASVIALALGVLFQPGIGLDIAQIQSMFSTEYAGRGQQPGLWEIIRGVIPENPVRALLDGNILQIIFFSVLFGFGLSALGREKAAPVIDFFNTINHALIWIIEKVMYTAPLGVFGLMADAVGAFGYDVLALIMKLLSVYVLALFIQTFGVYTFFVRFFSRVSPVHFFKKLSRAQIVALSTSSSMATLPVTMQV